MAGKSVIFLELVILVLFVVCDKFVNAIDDCQTHQFSKSINSTTMQFTKEAVSRDYALIGEFKSLHCCAKGYRSIEWFKNGQPYPWSSSLILYPQAENQTIYTRHATINDNGNYTCVIRNDTHKTEHVIEFTIQEDDQIVGALLTIPTVKLHNYGRFLCRIKSGNAARLEMSAWLFGTPIQARDNSLMAASILALGAVTLVIILMLAIKYTSVYVTVYHRRDKKLCNSLESSESIRIREVI